MQYVETNGVRIPAMGFGTFELKEDDAYRMVKHALAVGYRHIDTAQMYENEQAVGAALRDSDVPREDIFLTTKILPANLADGDLQASFAQSLKDLDTDYVDLLLQHWPSRDVPLKDSLGALNQVHRQGAARNIGISNFTSSLIEQAVAISDAPLVINQVEYHPYLDQQPVKRCLDSHGMALTAYCPLAQGAIFKDETLTAIAAAHDKNVGQIVLSWLAQQGVVAIPRTRNETHAESNLAALDIELSQHEMTQIHGLARADGRIINPASVAPEWDKPA